MAARLLFLFFSVIFPSLAISAPALTASSSGKNSMELIRTHCEHTIYPSFCIKSFTKYADAIRPDPIHLVQLAANLTVNRVRGLSIRVSAHARALAGPDAALLLDCADALVDAVDQAKKSATELNANGSEVAVLVGNVQLCMHAVVVDQDRCSDDFYRIHPGLVKDDMSRRIRQIKRFTMNAFSLLNDVIGAVP
ncbi:pectinesterase inhibitor 4-like [Cocos nucifera]|uniref:Pectinesterase inhibitor 4-like n=1 Tax=Cocos nucifera TaxID=13894 RepID=A0A8K0MYH3_COCNU|nr:pectinesterase inhibitor 4-like [Cocos nucifera]